MISDREPNLRDDGWEVMSAVEHHRRFPEFAIPTDEQRATLVPGDLVKLLIRIAGQNETGAYVQVERLWIEITRVADSGYIGVLDNEPRTPGALTIGAEITFTPDHVAAFWVDEFYFARHPPSE